MAVPSAMTDLTVDEATNVPADSETVTPALRPSDYLRSHAAIMRRPFAKGADVASATAANLGSNTDGDYFHITGTTGLAASNFGTVAAGIERTIVFDGALLLTHNATSFILPGGANITTAAGDVAVFRSEASGNWKCTSYVKASGAPIGSYQPLDATLTALASALTAANKIPYATATDTLGELDFKDEDNMASNSATALPSQQSVKAYVDTADALKAPLASPTFTGTPAAPTAATTTNTTQLATTAFVQQELDALSVGGMTLLGTLTTTSGTTQTLSGLTLTDYKMLYISIDGVSVSDNNGANLLYGSKAIGELTAVGGVYDGHIFNDLSSGYTSASFNGLAPTNTTNAYTTASTSVSFSFSPASTFDAGVIKVFGIK